jgi:hypothetical protein
MEEEPKLTKIAEDHRGASWSITLPGGQELVLIRTKAGFWRGGHSHNVHETSVLLSGRALYLKKFASRTGGQEFAVIHETGHSLHNEPGEVHAALALEDYWLIDLRPGTTADQVKSTNWGPWRRLVENQKG